MSLKTHYRMTKVQSYLNTQRQFNLMKKHLSIWNAQYLNSMVSSEAIKYLE